MKNKIKNILITILIILVSSSIGVMSSTFMSSKKAIYDNSKSGIKSINVQATGDKLYSAATDYSSLNQRISNLENNYLSKIYPVGSIYISATDDTVEKVKQRFGGEWERYAEGRTPIGVGTATDNNGTVQAFNINETSGEYKHTLTIAEMSSHMHREAFPHRGVVSAGWHEILEKTESTKKLVSNFTITDDDSYDDQLYPITTHYTGGSGSHNNIQPYITTYMYKRVK